MTKFRSILSLLFFILIVIGVSFSAAQFQPGEWYFHLIKPVWTPADWIFPVVWSALYLMIAVSGWLIFSGDNRIMKALWVLQLAFNGLWSVLFFGKHLIGVALADIVAMFFCILLLTWTAQKNARTVFLLMMPYLCWVAYASALNAAIYCSN